MPSCVGLLCGPTPRIANANNDAGRDVTAGGSVSVQCDTGYVLRGPARLRCSEDGIWDTPTSRCVAVQCNAPILPSNSRLSVGQSTFTFGNTVTLVCDDGFYPVGNNQITCTASGSWSASFPTCLRTVCQQIMAVENGNVLGNDTSVGAEVQFTCQPDYVLRGPSSLMCQSDGQWTADVPTCEQYICANPGLIANGIQSIESLATRVSYVCDSGYELRGSAVLQCITDVGWNATIPRCVLRTCPNPGDVTGGVLLQPVLDTYPLATVLQYSCDNGQPLRGASSLRCLPDGTWSSPLPSCQARTCPDVPAPANGLRIGSDFTEDGLVQFRCNDGFRLVGAAALLCTEQGTWNGSAPTCQGKNFNRTDM